MKNIIKHFNITNTWHPGFRRKAENINEIVIHGTHGKSANGLMQWILGGERSNQYKKGIALFHFIIDRLGSIYQIAPIDRWYYHSSSGKHDKKTIGIEFLNPLVNNEGEYTVPQYTSLKDLILFFMETYNIQRIVGHDYNYNTYRGNRKNCPGRKFEWQQIREMCKMHHIETLPELFQDLIEIC